MLKALLARPGKPSDDKLDVTVQDNQLMVQRRGEIAQPLLENNRLSIQISNKAKLLLAAKIARLVPELADETKWALFEYTTNVLEALCEEQLPRVRQMIAEELKAEPKAPHRLIFRLAQDSNMAVAGPVLECSPVLTDADLIAILEAFPADGVMESIAKRQRLTSRISRLILASHRQKPVTKLLENHHAEINDEDFEHLEDEAAKHSYLHEPLIGRPDLPMHTVNKLATLLSEALLEKLTQQQDLSPRISQVLREQIEKRLDKPSYDRKRREEMKAREDVKDRILSPESLEDALLAGQRSYVIQGLANLSGYATDTIERMLKMQNPKLLTALSWKAGCSVRFAMELQLRLGRIHHREVLRPKGGQHYPLTPNEMEHYLAVYA